LTIKFAQKVNEKVKSKSLEKKLKINCRNKSKKYFLVKSIELLKSKEIDIQTL